MGLKLYSQMSEPEKERARASKRAYNERNRDQIAARKREHYRDNKEKYFTIERDRQYRVRYGITLADYDRMLVEQGGKCKVCAADKAGKAGQCFAVDHCHNTGRVRGLLCIKCNARLGWLERHMEQAMKYLQES